VVLSPDDTREVLTLCSKAATILNMIIGLLQRVARRYTRVSVDSTRHPAEQYYADIYLDEIRKRLPEIENGSGRGGLKILDAGCGSGRIMVPISKLGHHFTGIDYHRDSLRMAKENLQEVGSKAELIEKNVLDALTQMDDDSFDVALAIESIFVDEQYETILKHMARVVRPGGLLFITHRTRYFYLTQALMNGHFDDLAHITQNNSGKLRKGLHRVYHCWQSRAEMQETYTTLGLNTLSLHAVGLCSGFGGDPLAPLCDPGTLDEQQRQVLRQVESCDEELLTAGRYVLAVAQKPQTT
jgi:2-polyprenyl-3-methyl-5-hydroxy-6-metoxy-1,4-benzoquinol methylase